MLAAYYAQSPQLSEDLSRKAAATDYACGPGAGGDCVTPAAYHSLSEGGP